MIYFNLMHVLIFNSIYILSCVNVISNFLVFFTEFVDVAITANPLAINKNFNEFDKYLGKVPSHPLSRRRRSGLIPCAGQCEPEVLEIKAEAGSKQPVYRIVRQELTWKDAHDYCEDNHGHLASFYDEKSAKQVVEAIFQKSKFDEDYDWGRKQEEWGLDRRYWIGLTDIMKEGKWAWVGKGKFLTYESMWYPGQPDHVDSDGTILSGRRQHCVSLWNPVFFKVDEAKKPTERHTFDDTECHLKHYAICEDDPELVKLRRTASGRGLGGGSPPPPPPPPPPKGPSDVELAEEALRKAKAEAKVAQEAFVAATTKKEEAEKAKSESLKKLEEITKEFEVAIEKKKTDASPSVDKYYYKVKEEKTTAKAQDSVNEQNLKTANEALTTANEVKVQKDNNVVVAEKALQTAKDEEAKAKTG